MTSKKIQEVVDYIDSLDDDDAEYTHILVDRKIIEFLPEEIAEAIGRAENRCGGFWYA